MRTLHVIMPMAGEGSRFLHAGVTTPKPLIKADGKPFFLRAIDSLEDIKAPRKYSFIVRKEHIQNYGIDKKMLEYIPDANIISVEETTRGAVETCMLAKNYMEDSEGIIVLDCDLTFKSREFDQLVADCLSKPVEHTSGGVLVSFNSNIPRYSYAKINSSKIVMETAEKEVISEHALAGAYFFSNTESFVRAANELLAKPDIDKPEYYVSLLYNLLIGHGENVRLAKIDEYDSFGTPEELQRFVEKSYKS